MVSLSKKISVQLLVTAAGMILASCTAKIQTTVKKHECDVGTTQDTSGNCVQETTTTMGTKSGPKGAITSTNTTGSERSTSGIGTTGSSSGSTTSSGSSGPAAMPMLRSFGIGGASSCGIAWNGVPYCWGNNSADQLGIGVSLAKTAEPYAVDVTAIPGDKTFSTIAPGTNHTCAISGLSDAYCWGENNAGQLGLTGNTPFTTPQAVPTTNMTGSKKFLAIVVGRAHTCALAADRLVYCWGSNARGQIGAASATATFDAPTAIDSSLIAGEARFRSIAAAGDHTCGVTVQGSAYCWGDNDHGALGIDTSGDRNKPTPVVTTDVSGEKSFRDIDVGINHACAVTGEAVGYCWGIDTNGQLGNGAGATADALRPQAIDVSGISGSKLIRTLAVGNDHSCFIAGDGKLFCWGKGADGRLGNASSTDAVSPTLVTTTGFGSYDQTFYAIDLAARHTCGTAGDGRFYCWGYNTNGELGPTGNDNATSVPTIVAADYSQGDFTFRAHSAGGPSCEISLAGRLYCMATPAASPKVLDLSSVTGSKSFIDITSNVDGQCAITSDGKIYCWGLDANGQIGNGAGISTSFTAPQPVDSSAFVGDASFVRVVRGRYAMCAITVAGKPYCWGYAGRSQLGFGTNTNRTRPEPISTSNIVGDKSFVYLGSGNGQWTGGCGITAAGVTYCWGRDTDGVMGNGVSGDNQVITTPVDTSGMTGSKVLVAADLGEATGCGLAADGVMHCWGWWSNGQLGIAGASADIAVPQPVTTTNITGEPYFLTYDRGSFNSCAISTSHDLYCWGRGTSYWGVLGIGPSATDQSIPVSVITTNVTGNKLFTSVSNAIGARCAQTTDGKFHCWGWDEFDVPTTKTIPELILEQSTSINFTSGIGSNSVADPGETLTFLPNLRSLGASPFDTTLTLTSQTAGVAVLQDTSGVTGLESLWSYTNGTDPFTFSIDSGFTCGSMANFNLAVASTSNSLSTTVPISIPTGVATISQTSNNPALAIPDNNTTGVTTTMTISGSGQVVRSPEFKVSVNITQTWRGDVVLTLTSPSGTTATLYNPDPGDSNDNIIATFPDDGGSVSAFLGEPVDGTWTLKLVDRGSGDTGTLIDWSIQYPSGYTCN